MFQPKLLASGLVAAAFLQAKTEALTSQEDIQKFSAFASAMDTAGAGYQWESHAVTTADGYQLTMMRLAADANDVPLSGSKGPLLLTHGMYSDLMTWMEQTDLTLPATPIQLADLGYDVWLGASRGRDYSRTHSTLNLDLPDQEAQFMDYSFEDVGRDDYPAMIDNIIANRPGQCDKVTLVTHSTGANAALIASLQDLNFDSKVSRIVSLAPCLIANNETFWIPEKDIESVDMLYQLLRAGGITSLFGPDHLAHIDPFCKQSDLNMMICQAYLVPPVSNVHMQENSLKYFHHVHQNLSRTRFQEFIEPGTVGYDTPLYDLPSVKTPTFAIFGDADTYCPPGLNEEAMMAIPSFTYETVFGFAHVNLISDNSLSLTQLIADCLPLTTEAVSLAEICPALPVQQELRLEVAVDGSDKSGSDSGSNSDSEEDEVRVALLAAGVDEEMLDLTIKLNEKLDKQLKKMEKFAELGKGDPEKIMKDMNKVLLKMDEAGVNHEPMSSYLTQEFNVRLAAEPCSGSDCDSDEDSGSGSEDDQVADSFMVSSGVVAESSIESGSDKDSSSDSDSD